jgi:hypothetical protein
MKLHTSADYFISYSRHCTLLVRAHALTSVRANVRTAARNFSAETESRSIRKHDRLTEIHERS